MFKTYLLSLLVTFGMNQYLPSKCRIDLNEIYKQKQNQNISDMEQINDYLNQNRFSEFNTNLHYIPASREYMLSHIRQKQQKWLLDYNQLRQLESANHSLQVEIVMLVFWQLIVGQIIKTISKSTHIPYTPLLTIFGVVIGILSNYGYIPYKQALDTWINIDPHIVLILFMPALIFESAFNSDWHIFRMQFSSILYAAGPLLTMSTVMSALTMRYILRYDGQFTIQASFLFGSIISATDPVAVVALLKELGVSKKLSTLIEGESLFNDGTAYVIFLVLLQIVQGKSLSVVDIVFMFLRLSLGGCLLGLLFGIILSWVLKYIHNDSVLECNSTVVCCYLVFYIAEGTPVHVSGILALVVLGLYMTRGGKTNISVNSEASLHHVWQTIGYSAETIIFILSGLIIGQTTTSGHIKIRDYLMILPLWSLLLIIRFIALLISYPLIRKMGYGLNLKQCMVLSYSALRGAVGLCLALIVKQTKSINQEIKDIIIFHTGMIALCTLVINAMTIKFIIQKLGLSKISFGQIQLFNEVVEFVEDQTDSNITKLQNNNIYIKVDWKQVIRSISLKPLLKRIDRKYRLKDERQIQMQDQIKDIFVNSQKEQKKLKQENNNDIRRLDSIQLLSQHLKQQQQQLENLKRLNQNDRELLNEVRDRYLTIVKSIYYEQFENGELMAASLIILNESVDTCKDSQSESFNDSDFIISYLNSYININLIKFTQKLPKFIKGFFQQKYFQMLQIGYDILLNYLEAHKEANNVIKEIVKNQKYCKKVHLEQAEQSKKIQNYMTNRFEDHFPEVMKAIQIRRAQNYLINHQQKMINTMLKKGQIDQKQGQVFHNQIDITQFRILNSMPEIELNDDSHDILFYSDLSKIFDQTEIYECMQNENIQTVQFLPKQTIENDKQSLIFISRGQVLEYIDILENDNIYQSSNNQNQIMKSGLDQKKQKTMDGKTQTNFIFNLEDEIPRQKIMLHKGQICFLRNLLQNQDNYQTKLRTSEYGVCKVIKINADYLRILLDQSLDKQIKLWQLISYRLIYFNIFKVKNLSVFEDWSLKNIQNLCQEGEIQFYQRGQNAELKNGGVILQGSILNHCHIVQQHIKKLHSSDSLDQKYIEMYQHKLIKSIEFIIPNQKDSYNYVVTSNESLVVLIFNKSFTNNLMKMYKQDQEDEVMDLQRQYVAQTSVDKKIGRSVTISMNNKFNDIISQQKNKFNDIKQDKKALQLPQSTQNNIKNNGNLHASNTQKVVALKNRSNHVSQDIPMIKENTIMEKENKIIEKQQDNLVDQYKPLYSGLDTCNNDRNDEYASLAINSKDFDEKL